MEGRFKIDLWVGDEHRLIELAKPPGGGDSYHVSLFWDPEINSRRHLGEIIIRHGVIGFHLNADEHIDAEGLRFMADLLNEAGCSNYPWTVEIRDLRGMGRGKNSRP